ncbi:hypothetical protein [Streptomyces sp. NPDC016626]|uniref:hypothetical protein n=1 Tax=Streptomyces sp. NPDC016626 TaxID=3364968 RepID=UPI0036F53D54
MELHTTEFWVGTYHGRHDGRPATVTATRDDTRPEPFAWTCTCGASRSFATEDGVDRTAWRHTPDPLRPAEAEGRPTAPHPLKT